MIVFDFPDAHRPHLNEIAHAKVQWPPFDELPLFEEKYQILAYFMCEDGYLLVYNTSENMIEPIISNFDGG